MQENKSLDSKKQEEFLWVATFLPLKSWKYMIPFQVMSSKVLKQAKETKGVMNYAVKADFPKSTSGRYLFGKIEILLGTLLWQSPMQLLLRSSLNGLERALHLWNGLAQVIQLIGQKLSNGLRIPPFTTRIKSNLLQYL